MPVPRCPYCGSNSWIPYSGSDFACYRCMDKDLFEHIRYSCEDIRNSNSPYMKLYRTCQEIDKKYKH